ncbi:MAG: hypothetical protein HYS55_01795 [Candidatus Omnitrophica bacterium]|nr:hypothetical protein [Candidatus Omnitrophota bacterium]
MQRALYQELWALRFGKMLALEETCVREYGALLRECKQKYKTDRELQNQFQKLIADEKKHAKLVRELLTIVQRQPA